MSHALSLLLLSILLAGVCFYVFPFEYVYVPPSDTVLNEGLGYPVPAFDVWGRSIFKAEADDLVKTPGGRALLPSNGSVAIDDRVLQLGRRAYYAETYGNEVFLTDVLGILDGPLTPWSFGKALVALNGAGTTNLKVAVAYDAIVGGRTFRKGELIETGLDVVKGSYAIVGLKVKKSSGNLKVVITCSACHSTVDPNTKLVIHGAPNSDLNAGLLIALAGNSAAFFSHTDVDLTQLPPDPTEAVRLSSGTLASLPEAQALEDAVDAVFLAWPPGGFDSMIDLVAAPTKLPSAFTQGNWPYSYSGAFMAGPFHGLSAQTNNVHGLNSDALTHAESAPVYFGIEKDVYVALVLRRAAAQRMRYDPARDHTPSDFLTAVDPTPGQPGLNEVVALPTFPKATLISPTSLWASDPGFNVWEKVNAMSAWQNIIRPPRSPVPGDPAKQELGRQIFARAGCVSCHAGPVLTTNQVIAADRIKTQPLRAKAMKKTEQLSAEALAYTFDQPVPVPPAPKTMPVPAPPLPSQQVALAFGWGNSPGGVKVPALVGLYWTAPYLHDGGVAVGPDADHDLGIPGTMDRHVRPNPRNSLRALLDRHLRQRVVTANRAQSHLVRPTSKVLDTIFGSMNQRGSVLWSRMR